MFRSLSTEVRQYLVITANYWAFTLSDGALRMLVLLYFHGLGYSPFEVAMLFVFYEAFGVITNLVGGWLAARLGLNKTMNTGLALQLFALSMLLVPSSMLNMGWVMVAQAFSGIAKDLNKMSAKTAVKLLLPSNAEGKLFHWVAVLTGSKNTLKGLGFFVGGALLSSLGFTGAIASMLSLLLLVFIFSLLLLKKELGQIKRNVKFTEVFSKSSAINYLSAARLFLFCSRDVWFVIALPVFLSSQLAWNYWSVGAFLAFWVIAYGLVQTIAPVITRTKDKRMPSGQSAFTWAAMLSLIPAAIALGLSSELDTEMVLLTGLLVFGVLFAINSSLHSYLIVSYARVEGASMDVGFYYMANAMGRLIGTLLSGYIYQQFGLAACLWLSSFFILISALIALKLPKQAVVK
ncbi:MAG: organoarsenical effux MFS transporter ArsJ [Cycloclasticus sp.]